MPSRTQKTEKWNKKILFNILKEIDALLFDLDGTLFDLNVNWKEIKEHFKEYTRKTHNLNLPSNRFHENFTFIEKELGKDALEYYHKYLEIQEGKTIEEGKSKPTWLFLRGLKTLKKMVGKNTLWGIVSSNFHSSIEKILKKFKNGFPFRILIGRDDVIKAKPNPEGLLKIIKQKKLSPSKVLFIGDTQTDEKAAKAANVNFIYIQDLEKIDL